MYSRFVITLGWGLFEDLFVFPVKKDFLGMSSFRFFLFFSKGAVAETVEVPYRFSILSSSF